MRVPLRTCKNDIGARMAMKTAIKDGCILICCWEEETVEVRQGVVVKIVC